MSSIIKYIAEQPEMKVLRSLLLSKQGVHLRALASRNQLSIAGVVDIIRRFESCGILKKLKQKNRIVYSLNISKQETEVLQDLFSEYEKILISTRAMEYNKLALKKFKWIDEAASFYQNVKSQK